MKQAIFGNQSLVEAESAALPPAQVRGLYVHVPFCARKCAYCDFYSLPGQSHERMSHFVELLLAEAGIWSGMGQLSIRPRTVFFGGGTPTLLPLEAMRHLLRGLKQRLDLSCVVEWTVEANPATLDAPYCQMLRQEGVDRLSIGAQSFQQRELTILRRRHRPADVTVSLEIARRAGFRRLSVDLIYAIPGQDLQSWDRSLQRAIGLQTGHISCYALSWEPDTLLSRKRSLGLLRPASPKLELRMMHWARQRLAQAGYLAYEISNYAWPGQECQHNLMYWEQGNYIGLGPSAASHLDGLRWRNPPDLRCWEQAMEQGRLVRVDVERLDPPRRAGELVMLCLRTARGVRFTDFRDRLGIDALQVFGQTIDQLARLGLLYVDADGFRLTERGIDVADSVTAEFFQPPVPCVP